MEQGSWSFGKKKKGAIMSKVEICVLTQFAQKHLD
jgi:hypothetical protein